MLPQVSVIIPVYNSVDYVRDAIRSVRDQTIDPAAVEILAVDDGSDDGSAEVLAELAAEEPRLTVITQENSGTPGGGRNPAIGRARGEFLFFLDSDDLLTPDALRRMVETAQEQDSDVVLGRMRSTDDRHAPSSMFGRTVLDADLVRDKVFNTLGPTKLIRRSLVERLGLRFPTDQRVGEDQPFMAAVYLNARKISVLADMDYYLIRHREDGSNLTLQTLTSADQVEIAVRLAREVEKHTEPGKRRDALLKRPFGWSMKRALDSRWSALDRAEQARLAETFRTEAGHLYTDGLRRGLEADVRILLDLLMADDLDAVAAYSDHVASKPPRRLRFEDGAFRLLLPEDLRARVPAEALVVEAPTIKVRLEDVQVHGQAVQVSATVRIPSLEGGPDGLGLRLRRRDSEDVEDLEVLTEDLDPRSGSTAVTARHEGPGRGIWDVFVVVRFGDHVEERRLGADRSRMLPPEGVSNLAEAPAPRDRLLAYYTQGPGNLSFDCGAVLHRDLGAARVLGLTLDMDARPTLLVATTGAPRRDDEYFAHLEGVPQHGGRQLLPATRLGERLVGLRLPLTEDMVGATARITAVLGGPAVPLPVSSTEHWPVRAAGYGLTLTPEGALVVTASDEGSRQQRSFPGMAPPARRRVTAGTGWGRRVAPVVKRAPVVGPVLTRAVRAIRDRRS